MAAVAGVVNGIRSRGCVAARETPGDRLLSVAHVARQLKRSEDSVRAHTVTLDEWRALATKQKNRGGSGFVTSKIPWVEIGNRGGVPAWWLEKLWTLLDGPPEIEAPEQGGKDRKLSEELVRLPKARR